MLRYLHSLLFDTVPEKDVPESVIIHRVAGEIRQALEDVREALKLANEGNFNYKITTRGFIGGTLKSLQSRLNHMAWMTQRVAGGDLEQRMDFMGDISEAFNSMTEQLATTLEELRLGKENLENLTVELRHEVDSRQATEKKLRSEEERWQLAVQCSRDGIWDVDLEHGDLPYYSPRLLELLKINLSDISSLSDWPKRFHPEDTEALELFRSFGGTNPPTSFTLDHRLLCGDGQYRWFVTRGMLVCNPETLKPARLIAVTADIQHRKDREELFSHRATHDVLTELPNRAFFGERLKKAIELTKLNGSHVAVIMADLDKFKRINDTMGHHAGDALLVEVAGRLRKSLRENDTVARFGGDEFAMIIAFGKNDWHGISGFLNRTMRALQKPLQISGKKIFITTSMGISVCPEDGNNPQELLMRADEALYHAKAQGRNACAFWKPDRQYSVVSFGERYMAESDRRRQ